LKKAGLGGIADGGFPLPAESGITGHDPTKNLVLLPYNQTELWNDKIDST